jgi:hypothetical protein
MPQGKVQFVGAELYFENLCLERKGLETYPSLDKAVVFLEVPDIQQVIQTVGRERILQSDLEDKTRQPWAVLHDPEGHNVILSQGKRGGRR